MVVLKIGPGGSPEMSSLTMNIVKLRSRLWELLQAA
jgi:hypothetical protein